MESNQQGEQAEVPPMPLRYFNNLRFQEELAYSSKPGSQLFQVHDKVLGDIRLLHVLHLMSLLPISPFIYYEAASLVALKHFNERSNDVLENLSEMLDGCNVYMTMDMLNAEVNSVIASSKLFSYFTKPQSLQSPHPAALLGATLSDISLSLAILTGAYGIPQLSPASQTEHLENGDIAPTFGRTVPTNSGVAESVLAYFHKIGVSHFYLLHEFGDYGLSLRTQFSEAIELGRHQTRMLAAQYDPFEPGSLEEALKSIRASGVKYIFGVLFTWNHREVLERVYDLGLIGPGYSWYLPDVITDPFYQLNRTSDAKYIAALNGINQVGFWVPPNPAFEKALINALKTDADFQSFFIESHKGDMPLLQFMNLTEMIPVITFYSHFAYDTVMTLGLAACNVNETLFTGHDYNQEIRRTKFKGTTGQVEFDPSTGTRRYETVKYGFDNFFIDEDVSTDEIAFVRARVSMVVDLTENLITEINPPIFADGTSQPPIPLSPNPYRMNLVPVGAFAVGWILAGATIFVCLILAVWVYQHRNDQAVRAAQPRFLLILLMGTILMAASIVPLSFQEPTSQRGLNIACMATPWLFCIGFSIAFSTIFTKTWRLSLIIQDSVDLKRSHLKLQHVMLPFFVILSINVALLVTWTMKAPLVWTRVDVGIKDVFDRSLESYGHCTGAIDEDTGTRKSDLFGGLTIAFNGLVVLIAFCQAFSKRHVPTLFNDAPQMALCTACMLESFVVGIPVLLLVESNPTASFLIQSLLTFAFCLAILIPNVGGKISRRPKKTLVAMQAEWKQFLRHLHQSKQSNASTRRLSQLRSSGLSSDIFSARSIRSLHRNLPNEGVEANLDVEMEEYASTVAELRRRASQNPNVSFKKPRKNVAEDHKSPQC